MKRLLFALLLLTCCGSAYAQYNPTKCATGIDCTMSGPVNTGTGDPWYVFGARFNIWSKTTNNMFGPTSNFALTGVLLPIDVASLFGCGGNSALVLNGAGGCSTVGGGGSTPGLPAFSIQYNNGTALAGLLPGAIGTFCLNWSSLSAAPSLLTCPGSGGGGTPGGNPGQSQYNNGGVFGGYTMSQDCTLVAATGVITCLRTNNTPFGSLATATTFTPVISLWTAGGVCSSSTFLRGDGQCQTPAGAGTVVTSGSPASGNLAAFSGSTAITNGNLSGDCTTTNTLATTCKGASTQFIAQTTNTTLSIVNNSATVSAASGAITITLPTAITDNHIYCVTKTDSTANTVTVNTTSAQTIQGNATEVIQFQGNTMCVKSDNANWWIT